MLTRPSIPERRDGVTVPVKFHGETYRVTFNWHPTEDYLFEVFYSHTGEVKSGSDVHSLLTDACISISLLVQRGGMCFEDIAEALGEERAPGKDRGPPSSILGAIAVAGAMIE